jgi:hypothetical protein
MTEHAATPHWCGIAMRSACLASLLASFAAAGCAAIQTGGGERLALTSPEFRAYVERVFREQNRVATLVAFALEAPGEDARLTAGEQRLLEACEGVNELATARRDERRLSTRRSLAAARTVPTCEETTRAVAELLTGEGTER